MIERRIRSVIAMSGANSLAPASKQISGDASPLSSTMRRYTASNA
jgi:hypothetical protein